MKLELSNKGVIEQMEICQYYCSLFQRLRKQLSIPVRQPLLDFAFGNEWIVDDCVDIIGQDVNIWSNGAKFSDKDHYYGYGCVRMSPDDDWMILVDNENDDPYKTHWVALKINMPDWLKQIGDDRKSKRQEIMKRKKEEKL